VTQKEWAVCIKSSTFVQYYHQGYFCLVMTIFAINIHQNKFDVFCLFGDVAVNA
jgi:hypothetical protein